MAAKIVRVKIEFDTVNASFEENWLGEVMWVLASQAMAKLKKQYLRGPPVVCDAPEAADVLMDHNGNTVGSVEVEWQECADS